MAGYSDNREQSNEIKYLRRVLSRQNEKIALPEVLSGSELLRKLPAPVQPPEPRRSFWSFRRSPVFAWQSGVSYAVAFALVIAVFYGFRLSGPQMIAGQIALAPQTAAREESEPLLVADGDAAQARAFDEAAAKGAGEGAGAAAGAPQIAAFAADDGARQAAAPEADIKTFADSVALEGVGGGGESFAIGEFENYTLTYRENDGSDPDKAGFPITLEIVDNSDVEPAAQVDIPDMKSVQRFCVDGDMLALIGESPEGGVTIRTYSGFSQMALAAAKTATQQGELADAKLYGGVIYTVTLCGKDIAPQTEPIALENSAEDGVCIITAMDIQSGELNSAAFAGAGSEISLLDGYMYIYYDGKAADGGQERLTALISFDGLNMAVN